MSRRIDITDIHVVGDKISCDFTIQVTLSDEKRVFLFYYFLPQLNFAKKPLREYVLESFLMKMQTEKRVEFSQEQLQYIVDRIIFLLHSDGPGDIYRYVP